jgi:type II secretory ATPase GspE/PulE/Tfp pilus assembly ATPase PilB-like protein
MILEKASPHAIREKSLADGMMSLRMCAIEKLQAGITTVEEVLGATS